MFNDTVEYKKINKVLDHKQTNIEKSTNTLYPVKFNVTKFIFSILFSIYLSLALLDQFILHIIHLVTLDTLLGSLTLILLSLKIRREHIKAYIFLVCLAVFFIISSLIVGRTSERVVLPFFNLVSCSGIAMILIKRYVYSWSGYIVFYSLTVYFFILMLMGIDGTSALTLTSRNGISFAILTACISLYIILILENKKIDLKPALVTLLISIWGIGVTGIVSSFVLLLGLLFVRFRVKLKYIFIIFILLLATYIYRGNLYILLDNNSFTAQAVENISKKIKYGNAARMPMWKNYYNNLDIRRLIFGVNVIEDPWPDGKENDYNYHNSFIQLHLQTGFMGITVMILILFSLFKFFKTNKVFFILLLAFSLRSSFDWFIFFRRFDFIPFFFIFYYLSAQAIVSESAKKKDLYRTQIGF